MKLVYEGSRRFLLLHPYNQIIENGTEIETTDKELIKQLKELGLKEVKKKKKEASE